MSKKAKAPQVGNVGRHSRRDILRGAGLAAGAAFGSAALGQVSAEPGSPLAWDDEADVICVGSGAAAGCAAVTALRHGARVVMLEKQPLTGGTTAKSGGVTWIANNFTLRDKGIDDAKADCLRYFARYSYPRQYDANSPTLGLAQRQYDLLEAFYDNGSRMIDFLQSNDIVTFKEFRLFFVDRSAPDYGDHLLENKVPKGRALEPASGSGSTEGGASLAGFLTNWFRENGGDIRTSHRVVGLVKDGDRVVGVTVETPEKRLRIKANRGVIFGTGGFAHNPELCRTHQPSLFGACAAPGATGDLIPIAAGSGARIGALNSAWRTQVVLDEVLAYRVQGLCAFVLPGDSMILVNRYGRRCVNEKRDYNDRTESHFEFDVSRLEYPNHLQFFIFDARSLDAFGGAYPIPADLREVPHLIQADTLDELSARIDARLAEFEQHTGGFRLDGNFADSLKETVTRFNGYAQAGKDPEFGRGQYEYDRDWHRLFSVKRQGTTIADASPNITMHPFSDSGPYYALIFAAGALDTNSGPEINRHAQMLDHAASPIPGLYGAGNCIASPTGRAYYGAGGTIGPALTFGFIAANHVMGSDAEAAG